MTHLLDRWLEEKVTLTEESVGTRYVLLTVRTFADPNDEQDLKEAYRLQDAVGVEQADIGKFEVPDWKKEQVEQMRDTIKGSDYLIAHLHGMP